MINRGRRPQRFLATILFTDMVGSTDLATRLGDREWQRVLAAHHRIVRSQLRQFGGHEQDTAGDGFFASFDQPAQAVRAADAILEDVAKLGLALRAGIHTGECERVGNKLGGIAVHTAARVMATATGGQVLVSSTVRDLIAGSRLDFQDGGTHPLKGLPGEWHLYELVREARPATSDAAVDAGLKIPEEAKPGRRRAYLAVAVVVGVLALAVIGVAAASLLSGAPKAALASPGPDTVVVLDRVSGDVVDVRTVPAGPSALAIDGSHLWVASLDAGIVSDLALTGGATNRQSGRVSRPAGLAVGGGSVWVTDPFDKSVTLIDAAINQPERTIDGLLARQIIYASDSAWATDDLTDRLLRLDSQSGEVAQAIDVDPGSYPRSLAFGAGAIWVGNIGTSSLARIDPSGASVTVAGILVSGPADAIAATDADVWVASRSTDQVYRVNPADNREAQTIDVADQPISIAVDGDTVWVGFAGLPQVWHIAHDGTTLEMTDVGGLPAALAISGDRVYVAVRQP